jgi:hypothetical protein
MAPTTHNILFLNSIDKTIWGGLENWIENAGRYDLYSLKKVSTNKVFSA